MSGFTRAAPWLRQLFTPSKTAQPNPDRLSDDVSLVQPYDGGGWPLPPGGEWALQVVTAAGAAADSVLVSVNANEIARILAVSFGRNAGVHPTLAVDVLVQQTFTVGLSAHVVSTTAIQTLLPISTPIIGPGHVLRGRHFGGDAATVIDWEVYFVRAPLGTVFSL